MSFDIYRRVSLINFVGGGCRGSIKYCTRFYYKSSAFILKEHHSIRSFRSYSTATCLKMYRVLLVVALIAFVGMCTAQLNFSPNWGKRSNPPAGTAETTNCKESVETVMLIYKIIQVRVFLVKYYLVFSTVFFRMRHKNYLNVKISSRTKRHYDGLD